MQISQITLEGMTMTGIVLFLLLVFIAIFNSICSEVIRGDDEVSFK